LRLHRRYWPVRPFLANSVPALPIPAFSTLPCPPAHPPEAARASRFNVAVDDGTAATLLARPSAKLMAQARLSPQRMYAASLAIWTVGETRWSTLQMYMASLLRFRRTLSCLFTELGHASPQAFLTLKSPGFWVTLQTAEWTIRRIASASFVLERDDTTPADVFYVYGSIYQHLAGSSVRLGEHGLTADLKRRWSQEEQALFSLAFCLHPCYMQPVSVLLEQYWRNTPASLLPLPYLANATRPVKPSLLGFCITACFEEISATWRSMNGVGGCGRDPRNCGVWDTVRGVRHAAI